MIRLGWATLIVATLLALFAISMVASAQEQCRRVRTGYTTSTLRCDTTYWFNRVNSVERPRRRR
jgi:hypothetical protein